MGKLEGYKVVITGATSGIGLGIAKKFIEEGATVIGVGRDFHRTTELGEKFIPYKADLYNLDQLKSIFDFAAEKYDGVLDVLVNCAGRGTYGTIENFELDEWEENFHLIMRAYQFTTKYAIPLMRNSKCPSVPNIINIASTSGHGDDAMQWMYCLGKASVIKFTRLTAKQNHWLRANSISPGIIDTPIFQWCTPEVKEMFDYENNFEKFKPLFPCKRIGVPEDIANVALLFASKDGEYIDGTDITIDGGLGLY